MVHGVYYAVYGVVHVKEPLLSIEKSRALIALAAETAHITQKNNPSTCPSFRIIVVYNLVSLKYFLVYYIRCFYIIFAGYDLLGAGSPTAAAAPTSSASDDLLSLSGPNPFTQTVMGGPTAAAPAPVVASTATDLFDSPAAPAMTGSSPWGTPGQPTGMYQSEQEQYSS